MPSFKAIFMALATLSATVIAGPVDTNDIFENPMAKRGVSNISTGLQSDLEKRAPNPPRNNLGARCRRNKQCYTSKALAIAYCNRGTCDFRCAGKAYRQGNHCVGAVNPPKCKYNANCPKTTVANATSRCGGDYRCTFKCNSGWHAEGNRCVKNAHLCGGKTCPKVGNGYAICVRGQWIPQCNFYLGYKLYSNKGTYQCVLTAADPNNCGRVGRVCPASYNGLGRPTCTAGVCGLNCSGYRTRTLPNGQKYCSKI